MFKNYEKYKLGKINIDIDLFEEKLITSQLDICNWFVKNEIISPEKMSELYIKYNDNPIIGRILMDYMNKDIVDISYLFEKEE
jgi:hypothetical protein